MGFKIAVIGKKGNEAEKNPISYFYREGAYIIDRGSMRSPGITIRGPGIFTDKYLSRIEHNICHNPMKIVYYEGFLTVYAVECVIMVNHGIHNFHVLPKHAFSPELKINYTIYLPGGAGGLVELWLIRE